MWISSLVHSISLVQLYASYCWKKVFAVSIKKKILASYLQHYHRGQIYAPVTKYKMCASRGYFGGDSRVMKGSRSDCVGRCFTLMTVWQLFHLQHFNPLCRTPGEQQFPVKDFLQE